MSDARTPLAIAMVYDRRIAGKRRARIDTLARELTRRGHTPSHHHGSDFLATRDAPEADLVCICGGDGTARLVIGNQSDPATLPPLAIYPVGTINLLARELGYPRDPVQFCEHVESAQGQTVTRLATIDGKPFLACASIGFDAHTVAEVSEKLKLRVGRLAYAAAFASLVTRWPRQPLILRTGEGDIIEAEALFVLRGRFYAGPWMLDRAAHLGHEKLRILALPRARRRDIALLLLYALAGSRRPPGHWRFLETDTLRIEANGDVPVQADGDVVAVAPVTIALTQVVLTFR